ncbi:DUF2087 domain-containing protein [Planctomonas psychrotolerans]|uniref:DUF2087 domain-containing protein n=1 Tax=Planctomonas psychrotolerans TaxID=2528712 RepID=UPI001D0D7463|nr:DUF2087 domain-containing protein [Planctomonas psychrotolerans]
MTTDDDVTHLQSRPISRDFAGQVMPTTVPDGTSTDEARDSGPFRTGNAWRAMVAALANEDLRSEYARIVLGSGELHERRTAQLIRAGLVTTHDGRPVPATEGLRALLADRTDERPQRGPKRFLRPDGAIDRYPSQHADREELLRHIAATFMAPDERLSEAELNDRLRPFDDDTALLRRYLVDYGILDRSPSGSEYFSPDSSTG